MLSSMFPMIVGIAERCGSGYTPNTCAGLANPHTETGRATVAYTLGTAAKATGVSKPTLARAIKSGKISATRKPDGAYSIEPAELHRVYPPVTPDSGTEPGAMVAREIPVETVALRRENELLREVVADLRRRLDAEAEERRRLTLMLTDQRPWWRRWWGR